jgi:hypothetical protein
MDIQLEKLLKTTLPEFYTHLQHRAKLYQTIGFGTHESPMWFQYQGILNNKQLLFKSSQVSGIQFTMEFPTDTSHFISRFHEIYQFYRSAKYDYLKENYPTIYNEIRPLHPIN